jgi:hypothetical protein
MYRLLYVRELMVVIHDEDGRRQQNIRFENNLIPAGDGGASAYLATAAEHDPWSWRTGRLNYVQPDIRRKIDPIAQADVSRHRPLYLTGVVYRDPTSKSRKRICRFHPNGV